MNYSYDRVEGTIAVLITEEGSPIGLPVNLLPENAQPGDTLQKQDTGWVVLAEESRERRRRIEEKRCRLLQKR